MDRDQLIAAIDAQERLRGTVPDEVVDTTVAVLRQRLDELDAAHHRRRQVTVVFADVRGFTSMSERLDAEHLTAVMNALWARLDLVVRRSGGTIDKHIGDALMAVWGGSASEEDDPERAVRAALALFSELARFRDETGQDLQMRVGVHTGSAVLGAVGSSGETTVMGDTVNVASRLEHEAPVGGVLVSHDTYRHVRGVFDVRPLQPLSVRGREEPVRAYEVLRAKPRAFRMGTRGVEGIETQMVGRDRELDELRQAFREVVDGAGSRLVTVVGDAGLGKSRLLYEFDNWLELEERTAYYFKGRATLRRRRVPYGVLRDLIAARCEVNESDPASAVRGKLARELSVALSPDEAVLVGRWLGFDLDPEARAHAPAERIAAVGRVLLVRYLGALASAAPVVVLLEDVHWADDESLDAIGDVAGTMRAQRVLWVAATRPELFERRADWGRRGSRLSLERLSTDGTRALVREVLRRADPLPDELVELVSGRADGNPFYVEELVKMLVDDGVIVAGEDRWAVHMARVEPGRVPTTLTGVLQARLDALPAAARRTLQRAAVIGRIFWSDAVAALGRSDGEPVELEPAVERELVYERRPPAFAHTAEFVFKHALLHDVTYESVLLSERPLLHAGTADWIEAVAGDRVDEYLVEVAEHRRRAGQLALAASWFERAARAAVASGAIESAHELATAAVDLDGDTPGVTRASALVTAATTSRLLGRHETALDEVERAITLARGSGDDHLLFAALFQASVITETIGDHGRARELLHEALPLAERTTDDDLATVYTGLGWSELHGGDAAAAERCAARSRDLAERSGSAEATIRALAVSSAVAAFRGDFPAAVQFSERAVEWCAACGDVVGEVVALCDLGVAWHLRADVERRRDAYDGAERAYRRSLELAQEHGLGAGAAIALANLAQLYVRTGRPEPALELARQALAMHVDAGGIGDALFAVLAHAEALAACGDVDTAVEHVLVVRAHPALGYLREEVAHILERFEADHGVPQPDPTTTRDLPDFESVVQRIIAPTTP